MIENFRNFAVTDPFGRQWNVEFRWIQNAISIRHSDSVDVKYYLSTEGEPKRELVIALMHPDLTEIAQRGGRELTDAWCTRLAGIHAAHVISTWDDAEKTIVTVPKAELEKYASQLATSSREAAEKAALYR